MTKTKKYTCDKCSNTIDDATLGSAVLKNGSVVIQCTQCKQSVIIIEKAECDWPFFIEGPLGAGGGCPKTAIYVLPYKTIKGIRFRCVCSEHVDSKHVIPFRYIGSKETAVQIANEIEKRHPALIGFFKSYFIFGIIFAPLLILHAFLASKYKVLSTTQFSVMLLLFGISWYLGRKIGFINIPQGLGIILRKVWLFVFVVVIVIENILHYLMK